MDHESHVPGEAVLAPLPRKRRRQARSPFVERVRKRRIDVGIPKVTVAPLELVPLQPPVWRKRLRGVSPTVRAAAVGVPGVELLSSGTSQGRDSVTQDVMEAPASAAVARLRAGRTVINLVRLMEQTMFNSWCDESQADQAAIERVYEELWRDSNVVPEALTPQGVPICAVEAANSGLGTMVVGEPHHDIIALRKVLSPAKPDYHNHLHDHSDAIHRLDAAMPCDDVQPGIGKPPVL